MDNSRSQPRFTMLLLGAFSATGLALAVIGICGVISYSVAQRRQEFGIRLALGAEHTEILRLVVRQELMLAIVGIAIGLTASALLTRLTSSVLYKVGTLDLNNVPFNAAIISLHRPARVLPASPARNQGRPPRRAALKMESVTS